jgi:hypothetical protein
MRKASISWMWFLPFVADLGVNWSGQLDYLPPY